MIIEMMHKDIDVKKCFFWYYSNMDLLFTMSHYQVKDMLRPLDALIVYSHSYFNESEVQGGYIATLQGLNILCPHIFLFSRVI